MRTAFFILILILTVLSLASSLGLAEEARPFVHYFDFNQPAGLQNPLPWDQSNGELHFLGGDPRKDYTNLFAQKVVPDFRLEVKTRWDSGGTESGFGVVYRYVDSNNYFAFLLSDNGRFRVVKVIKGNSVDLVPWKSSSILMENTINTLLVVCVGENHRFYVNNLLVAVISDRDFSQNPVNIGLFARGDLKCSFDDLTIEGVSSAEKGPFTGRPGKKVDFSGSSQGFSLQTPWKVEFGRLLFVGGPETEYLNVPNDDFAKPLTVSVKTNWFGKSKTEGYGMVFDYRDPNTYNVFLVSGEGNFRIARKFAGKWTDLVPWKKSGGFKGKTNVLSIEYAGKTITFYINGTSEAVIPMDAIGTGIYIKTGLYVAGTVWCSFDDFTLQEGVPAPKNMTAP